jgi:Na+/H+ antiporter NhaA
MGLTGVVVVCVVVLVIGLMVSSIWFPSHDTASLAQRVGTILSSLIGAIVGYLAGRGVTNGKNGGHQ